MWSLEVVVFDPRSHGSGSLCRGGVGRGIEPVAQAGLDESFGLAVGSGCVRFGADVACTDLAEHGLEGVAVGIGEGVVGHDALDGHVVSFEPLGGAAEELGRSLAALGVEDLGVGEAGMVVDADMEVLPAAATPTAAPAAADAVANAVDAAELLGVDVDELAGALAFVADDRRRRGDALLRRVRGASSRLDPAA